MRMVSAVAAATIAAASVAAAPIANADIYAAAINGKYLATSNGEYAKTNDSFHNEATVRQVWTITTTSCADIGSCTATVTSSQGWTVPAEMRADHWVVRVTRPDWMVCFDGTTAPGYQEYRFWPVDLNGQDRVTDGSIFGGIDMTHSLSGACGKNQPLVIRIPLRVQRIIE